MSLIQEAIYFSRWHFQIIAWTCLEIHPIVSLIRLVFSKLCPFLDLPPGASVGMVTAVVVWPSFLKGNRSGVVYKDTPPLLCARTRTSYDPSASSPGRVTFVDLLLVVVLSQISDPRRRHATSNVSYSALSSLVKTGRLTNTVLKPGRVPVSTTTRPWIQSGQNAGVDDPEETDSYNQQTREKKFEQNKWSLQMTNLVFPSRQI